MRKQCMATTSNSGTFATPLKVFGRPDVLISKYDGADPEKEIVRACEELSVSCRIAMIAYEDRM
jgi:hypothetical protein